VRPWIGWSTLTDCSAYSRALHDKGVGLCLHQQGIDYHDLRRTGEFQKLGVFAEFERADHSGRVNDGLGVQGRNGVKLGRRRVKPPVEAQIVARSG